MIEVALLFVNTFACLLVVHSNREGLAGLRAAEIKGMKGVGTNFGGGVRLWKSREKSESPVPGRHLVSGVAIWNFLKPWT